MGDYPQIQDYAVIGDCRSAALISKQGSLDWLCWPRFDSPAIFAAILDSERGGHWTITPASPCSVHRNYFGESNVLETHFAKPESHAVLTDLMPVASEEFKRSTLLPDHEIVRQVECDLGQVELRMEFQPRADYGRKAVRICDAGQLGLRMEIGRGVYWLRSSVPIVTAGKSAKATICLRAGQSAQFSLTYSEDSPTVLPPLGEWTRVAMSRSVAWWEAWARRCRYEGPYRSAVVRSVLALKLLTFAPSGAIVAAVTTSLPERIGADLNWDYRFCWLRDASLTIRALLGLGYRDEAESFLMWLLQVTSLTHPRLHSVYTLYGRLSPRERELNYLHGHSGSKPVRVGNAARSQLQLDLYGEMIDAAAYYAFQGGRLDRETQKILIELGRYVTRHWRQPDAGIWERRDGNHNHTHSRFLCWMALDRLLALEHQGYLDGVPKDLFAANRIQIMHEIENAGWNQDLQSFVRVLQGSDLDASLLLLGWRGFEKAGSKRMKATYQRLREQLGVGRLLYRYRAEPPEGAFAICSFWEVEYLARNSNFSKAQSLFEHLLSYSNDIGLFGEEIDPETGMALGNFPQAFTHVGLISAALALDEAMRNSYGVPPAQEELVRANEVIA